MRNRRIEWFGWQCRLKGTLRRPRLKNGSGILQARQRASYPQDIARHYLGAPIISREAAYLLEAKAASPHKSDPDGAADFQAVVTKADPYLGKQSLS